MLVMSMSRKPRLLQLEALELDEKGNKANYSFQTPRVVKDRREEKLSYQTLLPPKRELFSNPSEMIIILENLKTNTK